MTDDEMLDSMTDDQKIDLAEKSKDALRRLMAEAIVDLKARVLALEAKVHSLTEGKQD